VTVECLVGWNVVWQSGYMAKRALRRWLMVPEMGGRPVVAEMGSHIA